VTALSVLCSPPRSGVFIAVGLPKVCWASSHPCLSPSLKATEADQDSLVASLLRNKLANQRWTLYPLISLPLVGPVELVLGLVMLYRSPWIRYPGIFQGESYIGLRALAE